MIFLGVRIRDQQPWGFFSSPKIFVIVITTFLTITIDGEKFRICGVYRILKCGSIHTVRWQITMVPYLGKCLNSCNRISDVSLEHLRNSRTFLIGFVTNRTRIVNFNEKLSPITINSSCYVSMSNILGL